MIATGPIPHDLLATAQIALFPDVVAQRAGQYFDVRYDFVRRLAADMQLLHGDCTEYQAVRWVIETMTDVIEECETFEELEERIVAEMEAEFNPFRMG